MAAPFSALPTTFPILIALRFDNYWRERVCDFDPFDELETLTIDGRNNHPSRTSVTLKYPGPHFKQLVGLRTQCGEYCIRLHSEFKFFGDGDTKVCVPIRSLHDLRIGGQNGFGTDLSATSLEIGLLPLKIVNEASARNRVQTILPRGSKRSVLA